ncbi:MAG: hypothetical protein KatS3mg115_2356 [Candidatus Poribacteria bacterium]|nr:MAG: hypothetical protein KatS3mg115_2356 [Candidatus Poribacteria bacterium]
MGSTVLQRLARLGQEEVVLEFEQLYEMTERPEWGATLTGDLREVIEEFPRKGGGTGCPSGHRGRHPGAGASAATCVEALGWSGCCGPLRPPRGPGPIFLSIESVGGKELYDRALMYGDIEAIVAALGILAPRDMEFLWGEIVRNRARRRGPIPGGDTDCGHAQHGDATGPIRGCFRPVWPLGFGTWERSARWWPARWALSDR